MITSANHPDHTHVYTHTAKITVKQVRLKNDRVDNTSIVNFDERDRRKKQRMVMSGSYSFPKYDQLLSVPDNAFVTVSINLHQRSSTKNDTLRLVSTHPRTTMNFD